MIVDARQVQTGQVVQSDLCIVGAGAAGLTIANRLSSEGRTICLLESGAFDLDPDVQELYAGQVEATGAVAGDRYLTRSRLRYFGGSTNHWTGYCRPLEPQDFEVRPWVPHSGWPLSRSALDPYYREAARVVQIPPFDEEGDRLEGGDQTVFTESGAFVARNFHFSPPTRFARRHGAYLTEASESTLYLNASVVGIDVGENGSTVEQLRVSTLSGRRLRVRSRYYIVAAGGIENARLLLISDGVHSAGLGNSEGLVGRFFMEHPHVSNAGEVILTGGLPDPTMFSKRGPRRTVLCPSETLQRTHGLLNASVMLNFETPDRTPETAQRVASVLVEFTGSAEGGQAAPLWSGCYVRAEQAPNPDSRVSLSTDRDRLGVRRTRLDWRMTRADADSMRRMMELLGTELGRTGHGRARHTVDRLDPWDGVVGGDHHMGTTRMSETPANGVVNPDCRVHGVTNLYVAGSSVFPTAGFANPTLTIVALALRLADHLQGRLEDE